MERLKILRKKRHITQAQLATRMGVTQAALSGWETGKFSVDSDMLIKLADFFNCSTDYLLGRTDDPRYKKATASSEDDTVEYIIPKDMPELTPEEVKELKDFLRQRRS